MCRHGEHEEKRVLRGMAGRSNALDRMGLIREALGLAVCLRRIGPGADMADAEHPQRLAEVPGDVTGAVVGHHPLDPDAARPEPAQRADQEAGGGAAPLVGQHFDVGKPRGIVDGHVEEVVAHALARSEAVAGDAVADALEAGELLDIEVYELARPLALTAANRHRRLQALEPPDPTPLQPGRHGGASDIDLPGDLSAAAVLTGGREMATVLVTGASGMAGRFVVPALVEAGFSVRGQYGISWKVLH